MTRRVYLDYNSTTPIDPRVLQVVVEELKQEVGNPSSVHFHGLQCRQRLDRSRQMIASFLKVKPDEILFNSGGTEGAYSLLHGALQDRYEGHLVTSSVEHACVYQTIRNLEKKGCQVSYLDPGLEGRVSVEQVRQAIRPSTRYICLMAANNETGVKTDIELIARLAAESEIPFIVDGVSLIGKETFTIPIGVSAMFFSGHKCYAPKGIGFVFCRRSFKCLPVFSGGNQEFSRRGGTENLFGIVGLAKALEILGQEQESMTLHMKAMRDRLEEGIKTRIKEVVVNGCEPRLVNTTNLSFLRVDGESLLIGLDMEGVSVSHGSACSAGALEPSRILLNIGIDLEQAGSAIRFSVGKFTTEQDVDRCLEILERLVLRLRAFHPFVS